MVRRILLFVMFSFGSAAVADDLRNDPAQLNRLVDNILVAAQSVNGSAKDVIVGNALQLKKLISKPGSSSSLRALTDAELAQLVASLQSTKIYASQKAIIARTTANSGLWMSQLLSLVSCVDESSKHDLVSTFFPLVVDPENVDQLMQGSSTTMYVVATPAQPASTAKTYDETEIADLVKRIKAAWPYRSQKIIYENLNPESVFKMNQVKALVGVLDFPGDKKEILALLLPRTSDPENVDVLFDTFWTQSDKDYLNSLLPKKKR